MICQEAPATNSLVTPVVLRGLHKLEGCSNYHVPSFVLEYRFLSTCPRTTQNSDATMAFLARVLLSSPLPQPCSQIDGQSFIVQSQHVGGWVQATDVPHCGGGREEEDAGWERALFYSEAMERCRG